MDFLDCSKLIKIIYKESEEQWNNINKGQDWNKDCIAIMSYNGDCITKINEYTFSDRLL